MSGLYEVLNAPGLVGLDFSNNRRSDPYPGDRPVSIVNIDQDMNYGIKRCADRSVPLLRTEYSLRDRRIVRLSQSYPDTVNVRSSDANWGLGIHEAMAEVVHMAHKFLSDETGTRSSLVWKKSLVSTARSDVCGGQSGMLVLVDKIISCHVDQLSASDPSRRAFIVDFDYPRLPSNCGTLRYGSRYTYVKRIVATIDALSTVYLNKLEITLNCDFIQSRVVEGYDRTIEGCRAITTEAFDRFSKPGSGLNYSSTNLWADAKPEERIAMELLREIVTEKEWRRYLKRRFIVVRDSNGRMYQVFRDKWHSIVWEGGKKVAEICSRLPATMPPTDNVIAFKTMIESDEGQFEKAGNVYRMAQSS